jgi:hypothetical protein
MKEVSLLLGYDRRTTLQHFPDLCHAVSAKHRSYQFFNHKFAAEVFKHQVAVAAKIYLKSQNN